MPIEWCRINKIEYQYVDRIRLIHAHNQRSNVEVEVVSQFLMLVESDVSEINEMK